MLRDSRAYRQPHAVPYRESQRRVLVEALVDLAAGLAICTAFGLSILLLAWMLQALWPWSIAYVAIFGAGGLGLMRAASWGEE